MPTTTHGPADDTWLELLVEGAFEFGIPGLEQVFVAGVLVGESQIARERLLDNPRVVLGMAQTASASGLVSPPFLAIHYFKALIRWTQHKLGRSAAYEVAQEVGKEIAERVGADAARRGWRGVFKRLGVLGVEVLTIETLVPLIERILQDCSTYARTTERLQTVLEQIRRGTSDPDGMAEQLERIMMGD